MTLVNVATYSDVLEVWSRFMILNAIIDFKHKE